MANQEKIATQKKFIRFVDTVAALIALVIILIYFYEFELFIRVDYSDSGTIIKKRHESTSLNSILRTIMIIGSIITSKTILPCDFESLAYLTQQGVMIYIHYKKQLELQKLMKIRNKKDTLFSTGMYKRLVFEIVLNMIVCPPTLDGQIKLSQTGGTQWLSFDAVCFSISLFRCYLFLRLYQQYSRWSSEKSIMICRQN